MSNNYFTDNDDLRFQLSRVDWATLVPLVEGPYGDEDAFTDPAEAEAFYLDLLQALGAFAAKEVAPHWREFDQQHPTLVDGECCDPPRMAKTMAGLRELGAMGLALPRRLGGLNTPLLISTVFYEILARADVSCMAHFGFHGGIAQAMLLYSLDEGSVEVEAGRIVKTRFDNAVRKMAAGEEWGAMVLTEPNAGSDLATIRTTAKLDDDGSWRVSGQKIYITSGHGEHHIVLARSEDPKTHPGLKGLSLFYVPRHVEEDGQRKRNFEIGGIEQKMGQHSAVAATLHYEGAKAELIGTRGHGFLGMLLLMNNARIAVGFEALAILEASYRMAASFAEERSAMGKPIAKHEMIADYLDEMDVTIRGLRAMCFEAAFAEEVSHRMKAMLKVKPPSDDDVRQAQERTIRRYRRRARFLTPLIKYLGGEEAVRFSRMAMQIAGGIGYITEFGAEKIHRDALVVPVYEGTSQIQALMVLKDNLQSVMRNPGKFFGDIAGAKLDAVRAKDPLDRALARLRGHALAAQQTLLTRIAADKLGDLSGLPILEWKRAFMSDWDPKRDFSFGLLHAERLTKILCDVTMAEVLVRQAHEVAGTKDEEERRELALRLMERVEPRVRGVLGEIESTSGGLLGRLLGRRKRPAAPGRDGRSSPGEAQGAGASASTSSPG